MTIKVAKNNCLSFIFIVVCASIFDIVGADPIWRDRRMSYTAEQAHIVEGVLEEIMSDKFHLYTINPSGGVKIVLDQDIYDIPLLRDDRLPGEEVTIKGLIVRSAEKRPSYLDSDVSYSHLVQIDRIERRGREGRALDTVDLYSIMAVRVVMNNLFDDDAEPSCSEECMWNSLFDGELNVADQLRESSNGLVVLERESSTVETVKINLFVSNKNCLENTISTLADAALADRGVFRADYRMRLYSIPNQHTGCSWSGLAYIGCSVGNCRSWVRTNNPIVINHELGHSLGLIHSASPTFEYGDSSCVMGFAFGWTLFNMAQRYILGWISEDRVIVEPTSTSLSPAGSAEGVIVAKFNDLYVSYRSRDGNIEGSYENNLADAHNGIVQLHSGVFGSNTVVLANLEVGGAYESFDVYIYFNGVVDGKADIIFQCGYILPSIVVTPKWETINDICDGSVAINYQLTIVDNNEGCPPYETELFIDKIYSDFLSVSGFGECNTLTVAVIGDMWPEDISWTLVDAIDIVVASGIVGTYTIDLCGYGNQYKFTILDNYGDGIYAPGGYTLYLNDIMILQGDGGSYFVQEKTFRNIYQLTFMMIPGSTVVYEYEAIYPPNEDDKILVFHYKTKAHDYLFPASNSVNCIDVDNLCSKISREIISTPERYFEIGEDGNSCFKLTLSNGDLGVCKDVSYVLDFNNDISAVVAIDGLTEEVGNGVLISGESVEREICLSEIALFPFTIVFDVLFNDSVALKYSVKVDSSVHKDILWETKSMIVGDLYQTVELSRGYYSMVVICTVNYPEKLGAPVHYKVRIGGEEDEGLVSSFEIKLYAVTDEAFVIPPLITYCIIAEEGVYNGGDSGVNVEVGIFETEKVGSKSNRWIGEEIVLEQSYEGKVILGGIQNGGDDEKYNIFFVQESRMGRGVGEDSDQERGVARVGYIVMDSAVGEIGGVPFQSGLTGNFVQGVDNSPPYKTVLDLEGANFAIATMNGLNGIDGGFAVLFGERPFEEGKVGFAIDEDMFVDVERMHITEKVGYLVMKI